MAFFLMLVFLVSTKVIPLHGQQGFVSIDCGYNGDSYTDDITKLTYVSDAKYIDTGKTYNVSSDYTSDQPIQTQYVRSFPEGDRNCYTIDGMNRGAKYLIRASFLYGNYDGQSTTGVGPIIFDLYLGVSFWQTVIITYRHVLYMAEIVTVATANYASVCLVNTKIGVPFISALELRLIDNKNVFKDVDQSVSLVFPTHYNLGAPDNAVIRYPDDKYDRIWTSCCSNLETMATNSLVKQSEEDPYDVPSKVIQTAGASIGNTMSFYFDAPNTGSIHPTSYIYLHFAEFLSLNSSESRIFQVSLDGQPDRYNCSPTHLVATHLSFKYVVRTVPEYRYLYLTRLSGSTHYPMLNAIEYYTAINLNNLSTEQGDVDAMWEIKKLYRIKEWQGDPCVPKKFTWRGVNCILTDSNPPRVASLILSSHNLTGEIPGALAKLTALQELDLSTNNLQGPIPEFLAGLSSLRLLKLSWNNLSGLVPAALLERQKFGSLILGLEHNSLLCYPSDPCASQQKQQQQPEKEKKKLWIILVASIVPGVVILLSLVSLVIWLRRRNERPQTPYPDATIESTGGVTPVEPKRIPEIRRFAYLDVQRITTNFKRVIGKGGFGIVYYGVLEDNTTEVAVKVRGHASEQGTQEFNAEADLLSTAQHKNLLSLVGYCEDGNHLALIYPYMANGSLRDHLFDGHSSQKKINIDTDRHLKVLSWAQRLKIATEAAQGLDFLHTECGRPIVHRDVKTHNILLTENFEAKISDVGMSKPLPVDMTQSFIEASKIVGTYGYLDPEYFVSFQLNEKSDVFSFGVVLLELITGVQALGARGHIVEWVGKEDCSTGIASIVDAKLQGEYEPKSIQEVLKLAMWCTVRLRSERPTMKEVVTLLGKSLELEVARGRGKNEISGEFSTEMSQSDSIEMVRAQILGRMSTPAAR